LSLILGCAFSALGRKEDALLVWEKGYEHAVRQTADLKQLLELEELVRIAKQERSTTPENNVMESRSSMSLSGSGPHTNGKSSETYSKNKLVDESKLCSESKDKSEIHSKFSDKAQENTNLESQMNGNQDIVDKLSYESDSCSDLSDTSESCSKLSMICDSSSNTTETHSKLSDKSDIHNEITEEAKRNKKFCVARISKTKSISVDFRLSRGIAQVFFITTSW
jgi:hypothetical protein